MLTKTPVIILSNLPSGKRSRVRFRRTAQVPLNCQQCNENRIIIIQTMGDETNVILQQLISASYDNIMLFTQKNKTKNKTKKKQRWINPRLRLHATHLTVHSRDPIVQAFWNAKQTHGTVFDEVSEDRIGYWVLKDKCGNISKAPHSITLLIR